MVTPSVNISRMGTWNSEDDESELFSGHIEAVKMDEENYCVFMRKDWLCRRRKARGA